MSKDIVVASTSAGSFSPPLGLLDMVVSIIFYVRPYLVNISILTNIFSNGLNQPDICILKYIHIYVYLYFFDLYIYISLGGSLGSREVSVLEQSKLVQKPGS